MRLRNYDTVLASGMAPCLIPALEAEGMKVMYTSEKDASGATDALATGEVIKGQQRSRRCRP